MFFMKLPATIDEESFVTSQTGSSLLAFLPYDDVGQQSHSQFGQVSSYKIHDAIHFSRQRKLLGEVAAANVTLDVFSYAGGFI